MRAVTLVFGSVEHSVGSWVDVKAGLWVALKADAMVGQLVVLSVVLSVGL